MILRRLGLLGFFTNMILHKLIWFWWRFAPLLVFFRDSKDFVDGVDDAVSGVLVQLLQNNIKVLNVEYCKTWINEYFKIRSKFSMLKYVESKDLIQNWSWPWSLQFGLPRWQWRCWAGPRWPRCWWRRRRGCRRCGRANPGRRLFLSPSNTKSCGKQILFRPRG